MKKSDRYKSYVWAGIVFTTMFSMFLFIHSCKKLEIERTIVLRTGGVINITTNSATLYGIVLDIGETEIDQYGHCWSLEENPVAELDTKTNLGSRNDVGDFSSDIGGLQPATRYYVRSYAISDGHTIYGDNISFTTEEIIVPAITTAEPSDITVSSALCGGNVTSDGGDEVIVRGVCWSTSPNPTISDYKTNDGSGTGSFISNITGLSPSTEYYARAYATNEAGTSYGDQVEFRTFGVIDYDGNGYYSVVIGDQEWMQQNLRTSHYADGTPLSDGTDAGDIRGDYTAKYFFVNINISDDQVEIYGKLYTWTAVMNESNSSSDNPSGIQGICPAGWHIPSDEEWKELEIYLGMSPVAANEMEQRGTNEGGRIKSVSYFLPPNTGATNETGFSAVPGGDRSPEGYYSMVGNYGVYWTATENNTYTSYVRALEFNHATITRYNDMKHDGFSVRCLKD